MAQGKGWNETSDKEPRMTFPDLLKGKNKNSVVSMHCSQARFNTTKVHQGVSKEEATFVGFQIEDAITR